MTSARVPRARLQRKLRHLVLACCALLCAATSAASAQPTAASADDERPVAYPKPHIGAPRSAAHPVSEQWYGLPLAGVGLASVVVTLIGGAADSEQAVMFGITTGVTSGLLFHMLISRVDQLWWGVGKGLLSVGLRFGLGSLAAY